MKKHKISKFFSIFLPLTAVGAISVAPVVSNISTAHNIQTVNQTSNNSINTAPDINQNMKTFSSSSNATTYADETEEQEDIVHDYHVAQIPSANNNYEYFPSNNIYFEGSDWNSGSYQRYELPSHPDLWWSNKQFKDIFPDPTPFRTRIYNIITGEHYIDDTAIPDLTIDSESINKALKGSFGSQYGKDGELDLSGIQMTNYQFDMLKFFNLSNCRKLNISHNRLNFLPENLFTYLRYNPNGSVDDPGFIAKYALQIGFPNLEILVCNGNRPYEEYGQTISEHFFETKLLSQTNRFTGSWFTYSNTRINTLELTNSGLSDPWCYSLLKYPGNTFTTLQNVNISKNYKITNNAVYPGFTGPLLTNFLYFWTSNYQLPESRNFIASECSIESIDVDELENLSFPSLLRSQIATTYVTPDFEKFDISYNKLKRLNVNNSNYIGNIPLSYVKTLYANANNLEYVSDFKNFNAKLDNSNQHTFEPLEILNFDFTDNIIDNKLLTAVLRKKGATYELELPVEAFPSYLYKSAGFKDDQGNQHLIWQGLASPNAKEYWASFLKTDSRPLNITDKIIPAFSNAIKNGLDTISIDLYNEVGQNIEELFKTREISFNNKYKGIIFNFSVRVRREISTNEVDSSYTKVEYNENALLNPQQPEDGINLKKIVNDLQGQSSALVSLLKKKPSELKNIELDKADPSSLLYNILKVNESVLRPVESNKTNVSGVSYAVVSVVPGRTIISDEYGAIRLRLQINNGKDIYGNRQTFDVLTPWIYGFQCETTKVVYESPLNVLERLSGLNAFKNAEFSNIEDLLFNFFTDFMWNNIFVVGNDLKNNKKIITHNDKDSQIINHMKPAVFANFSENFFDKMSSKNLVYKSFSPVYLTSNKIDEDSDVQKYIQLPYIDFLYTPSEPSKTNTPYSFVDYVLSQNQNFFTDGILNAGCNEWNSTNFNNFIEEVKRRNNGVFPSFKNWSLKFNVSYLFGATGAEVPTQNYSTPWDESKKYLAWTMKPENNGILGFSNKEGKSIMGYEENFIVPSKEHPIDRKQLPENTFSWASLDNPSSPLEFLTNSEKDLHQLRNNLEAAYVTRNDEKIKFKDLKPSEVSNVDIRKNLKFFLSDYSLTNVNPLANKNILESNISISNPLKVNDLLGSIGFDVSYKLWTGYNADPSQAYILNKKKTIPNLYYDSILRQQETIIAFNSSRQIVAKLKKIKKAFVTNFSLPAANTFINFMKENFEQAIDFLLTTFDKNANDVTPTDISHITNIFNAFTFWNKKLNNFIEDQKQKIPDIDTIEAQKTLSFWTRAQKESTHLIINCLINPQYSVRFDLREIEPKSFKIVVSNNMISFSFVYNNFFPTSGAPTKKRITFSSPILKADVNLFTTPDALNSNISSTFLYLKPLSKYFDAGVNTYNDLKNKIIESINEIIRIPNIRVADEQFWKNFKEINKEALEQIFFNNEKGDRIEPDTTIDENTKFSVIIPSLVTDFSIKNEKYTFESELINSNFFLVKYVPDTVWIVSLVIIIISAVLLAAWLWFLFSSYKANNKESKKIIKYFQNKKIEKTKKLTNSEKLLNHPITASNGEIRDIVESFDSFLKIDLEETLKPKKDSEEF